MIAIAIKVSISFLFRTWEESYFFESSSLYFQIYSVSLSSWFVLENDFLTNFCLSWNFSPTEVLLIVLSLWAWKTYSFGILSKNQNINLGL